MEPKRGKARWLPNVSLPDYRDERIRWIAAHVLPHEADVRAWLRKSLRTPADVDDVLQEAYCRLAELPDHTHIRNGRAYFFATIRSIVIATQRRARAAPADLMDETAIVRLADDAPSPEREVDARLQLRRVLERIAALPPAYRHALEMRRVHGFSQKETARHLGVTEKVVENNALRGLRLLMNMMAGEETRHADLLHEDRDEPAVHALH